MSLSNIEIESIICDYVISRSLVFSGEKKDLPLDSSLIETGILDSYEMIELIHFMEEQWKIKIESSEFTKEKMGSIRKMSLLVVSKI